MINYILTPGMGGSERSLALTLVDRLINGEPVDRMAEILLNLGNAQKANKPARLEAFFSRGKEKWQLMLRIENGFTDVTTYEWQMI